VARSAGAIVFASEWLTDIMQGVGVKDGGFVPVSRIRSDFCFISCLYRVFLSVLRFGIAGIYKAKNFWKWIFDLQCDFGILPGHVGEQENTLTWRNCKLHRCLYVSTGYAATRQWHCGMKPRWKGHSSLMRQRLQFHVIREWETVFRG